VLAKIVARSARNNGNVRLGLGFVVRRDRELHAYRPSGAERGSQRVGRQLSGHRVGRALRLSHDQAAREQLDGLVLVEDTQLDQPVVFLARPAARADERFPDGAAHAATLATPSQEVNVPNPGRVYFGRLWASPKR
jgi:hypothetical protein